MPHLQQPNARQPSAKPKFTRRNIEQRIRSQFPVADEATIARMREYVEQRLLPQTTPVAEGQPEPNGGPKAFALGAAKAVPEILKGLVQYGTDIATTTWRLFGLAGQAQAGIPPTAEQAQAVLGQAGRLVAAPVTSAFQAGREAGEAAFTPSTVSAEEAGRRAAMLLAFVAPGATRYLPKRVRARVQTEARAVAAQAKTAPEIRQHLLEQAPRLIGEEARVTPQNGVVDAADVGQPASAPSVSKIATTESMKADTPTPSIFGVQGAGDLPPAPSLPDMLTKAKQTPQAEPTQLPSEAIGEHTLQEFAAPLSSSRQPNVQQALHDFVQRLKTRDEFRSILKRFLDPQIREALANNDNLGFDTLSQAASAILEHSDWMSRWEVDAELRQVGTRWRKETLQGIADFVETRKLVGEHPQSSTLLGKVEQARQAAKAEHIQRGEAGFARVPPPKTVVYKSADPQVEAFFKETSQPATRSARLLDEVGGKLRDTFVLFNRLRTSRTNPGSELFDTFYADAREVGRQGFDARRLGATGAIDLQHYITSPLDRASLDVFRRVVVLRDLVNTASRGITLSRNLQVGQLQAELTTLEPLVQQSPALQTALQRHVEVMQTMTKELVQRGVLDAKTAEANPHYFPHQVLDYLESKYAGTGGDKLRRLFRGYTKQRRGALKDIYTDYLEVMYGHFAKVLRDNRIDDVVQRVAQAYDVEARPFPGRADQLVQMLTEYQTGTRPLDVGQRMPRTIRELPDVALGEAGHARYYYAMPRAFYQARTISESAITRLLDDIAHDPDLAASNLIDMQYFKQALAVGRGPSVIIPKELGEVLEGYRDQYFSDPSGFVADMTRGFKQLVLNVKPTRYNRRNLFGDAQRVVAATPQVFQTASRALKDELKVLRGKTDLEPFTAVDGTVRTRYELANERAVISSGRTGVEVGRIREVEEFQRFLEHHRGELLRHPLRTYSHAARRLSQAREDWLRLAAFYRNLDHIEAGKPLEYGISDPRIVDAITDPVDRAAKISRELLGDYGGLTKLENQWRNGLVPFYAWLKINSTFWPALVVRQSFGSFARGGLVSGARASAWLASRVALVYVVAQVWNNLATGEQEDSLQPYLRRQFHLNTGMKDDEGRWITLTDPTALDDFLQTVGLDGASPELRQLFQGQLTMGEWLERRGSDMLRGPARAVLTMLGPVATVPLALTGKQLYPDPFNMRDIPPYNRIPDAMRQVGIPPEILDLADRGTLPDPQKLLPDILPVSPLGISVTKPTQEPALVEEAMRTTQQLEAYIRDLEARQSSLLAGISLPNATEAEREAEAERLDRILHGQYEKLDKAALNEAKQRARVSRSTAQ